MALRCGGCLNEVKDWQRVIVSVAGEIDSADEYDGVWVSVGAFDVGVVVLVVDAPCATNFVVDGAGEAGCHRVASLSAQYPGAVDGGRLTRAWATCL